MRAKHLVIRAFSALRSNLRHSTGDRLRTRKILMLRAGRLIRTVFYDGLVEYMKMQRIMKAKKVTAQLHKNDQL